MRRITDRELTDIEAQADDTVPSYVFRLIDDLRRERALVAALVQRDGDLVRLRRVSSSLYEFSQHFFVERREETPGQTFAHEWRWNDADNANVCGEWRPTRNAAIRDLMAHLDIEVAQ